MDVVVIPIEQLRTLLVEACSIALKHNQQPAPAPATNALPIANKRQIQEMTGWPDGTFYAKVREMPEGVVIRGKSKRLLFDREKFVQWLKTPDEP